jgi:hypothetical protein
VTQFGFRHIALALALALTAAPAATAHPDHDMYETENPRQIALTSASYVVGRMVERGAIEPSWRQIAPSNAVLRQRNGANEWVVTFRNDAITNEDERTLYVMLSYTGVFLAANYSGE